MYEGVAGLTESFINNSIDGIVESLNGARVSFSDIIKSMLIDLQKLALKAAAMQIFNGLVAGGSSSPTGIGSGGNVSTPGGFTITDPSLNANGGVYSGKGISSYSGNVVSKPTVFPFAKGIGLMGEAGEEAILPLKRGSNGKLGVESSGAKDSNKTKNIIVKIENLGESKSKIVESTATTDINGTVVSIVLDDLRNGGPIRDSIRTIGEYS